MADFGSGHWYTSDGKPKHWQKDGKKTTLRHARTQNLSPSVSAIIGVISNDFLNSWKIGKHLEFAYAHKPWKNETQSDYVQRVKRMARSEQGETLDFGTRTHAALEAINKYYIDEQRPDTE
jgi:hypothetical protein